MVGENRMNFLPLPENISTFGVETDSLTHLIAIITFVAFMISEALLFYAIIKFRKKSGQKASYLPGTNWAQLKWIYIPLIIIVITDLFIDEKNTHAWQLIKTSIPEKSHYELVEITGQQFSWKFNYPGEDGLLGTSDDFNITNELHIPVNETIVFYLKAKDVLHSFSVPVMRFKQDALPGRTIKGWFDATKTGEYDIACAEICGVGHSTMKAKLVVHDKEDFKNWVKTQTAKVVLPLAGTENKPVSAGANASTTGGEMDGKTLLDTKGCLGCHSLDGSKIVGPSYKGLFGRKNVVLTNGQERELTVDEAYIRQSIQNPTADVVKGFQGIMPTVSLTDKEIETIIAYLKELK